jgi:hypothetical protein
MGPTDAGPNFVVPGGEKLMDIGKEMRKLHRKNYGSHHFGCCIRHFFIIDYMNLHL